MKPLYYALARGCRASAALRFAMDLVVRHGGRGAAPRAWAGFVVVGADTRPLTPADGAARERGLEGAAGVSGAGPDWETWTADAVGAWLSSCGLGDLRGVFESNEVDGETLADWARRGEESTKRTLKAGYPRPPRAPLNSSA